MGTEIKLNLEDPALAVHVLGVAAIKYEADKDLDAVGICLRMADQIEEQVKPAIEEPRAFGSVVKVTYPPSAVLHFCRTYSVEVDKPWCSGNHLRSWADVIQDASDVEVLRVGLGGENPLTASDLSRMSIEANAAKINAERDAYDNGARDMAAGIHASLIAQLAEAITSERKNAYEKAIQAVEELAP